MSAYINWTMLRDQIERSLVGREKGTLQDLPDRVDRTKPAAVILPVFLKDDVPHILLTMRTDTVRHHKSQISFPGGVQDPGEELRTTALREIEEELGIAPGDVDILGELDDYITITNYRMTPFVAMIPHPYEYTVNEEEIAEVIELELRSFFNPKVLSIQEVDWYGVPREIVYFNVADYVIWGATGRVLLQFIDIIRQVGGGL